MCECRMRGVMCMNMVIRQEILSLASNGVLLASDVTNAGIHRGYISEMLSNGELVKASKGVYLLSDEIEDEYYLLQKRYSRGVFSHTTALYLLGYSDRVPLTPHLTFPAGYNSPSLQSANVLITRVSKENYGTGITTVTTSFGNAVQVYDLERSLCDVLRGQGDDIQTIQSAFKKYALSNIKDINKLTSYAKQFRVGPKVRRYMEVLL